MEDKIEVKTTAGTLRAYKSTDPGQPGICVMLQPKNRECEIDISYVSVYQDPEYKTGDNENPEDVCIMTYADPYDEGYTNKHLLRGTDIAEATKDEAIRFDKGDRVLYQNQYTAFVYDIDESENETKYRLMISDSKGRVFPAIATEDEITLEHKNCDEQLGEMVSNIARYIEDEPHDKTDNT